MIERHGNEETEVYEAGDDPRKPWQFACQCGALSNHTTERAAERARKAHMEDEFLFKLQCAAADGRVQMALQALHARLNEANEARNVYNHFLENRGK